jgi:hypothetical protein
VWRAAARRSLLATGYWLLASNHHPGKTKFAPRAFCLGCLFCQNREEKIASGWRVPPSGRQKVEDFLDDVPGAIRAFHVDDRCWCCGLLPALPVAVRWALPDRASSDVISEKLVFMTWPRGIPAYPSLCGPCREHVDGHGASNQLVEIVTPRVAGAFVMMDRIVKGNPVFWKTGAAH